MIKLKLLLMILAVLCFALGASEVKPPRGNFVAAGLCLWALATVVAG
ncbi:MAG TPA: hypothetical protein VE030_11200 [Burkholderiales bacterium]|nr:hypothetical protein [Burkholderiales bacterium]